MPPATPVVMPMIIATKAPVPAASDLCAPMTVNTASPNASARSMSDPGKSTKRTVTNVTSAATDPTITYV